jgi:hypothetical protein
VLTAVRQIPVGAARPRPADWLCRRAVHAGLRTRSKGDTRTRSRKPRR